MSHLSSEAIVLSKASISSKDKMLNEPFLNIYSTGFQHSVQRPTRGFDWLQTRPQKALFQGPSLGLQVLFRTLLCCPVPPHGTRGMAWCQKGHRGNVQK